MKKILFLMVLFGVALYMDNAVLGVLSFVVLVAYSIALVISNVRKAAQKPKTSVSVPVEVSTGPDYFCKIAGVQYRNDAQDIGGFLGGMSVLSQTTHTIKTLSQFTGTIINWWGIFPKTK